MFTFDWLIFMIELGFLVSLLFVIMGLVAVICTFLGWKDDEKNK